MISKAYALAKEKHEGQTRMTGGAYFQHPKRVAEIVFKYKESKEIDALMASALLHDIVEDTDTSLSDINEAFGELVASLVKELTSTKEERNNYPSKAQYLSAKMVNMTNWGLVIKLADRLDNVSDLDKCTEEFRLKYTKETRFIIESLLNYRNLTSTQWILVSKIREILQF